MAEVSLGGTPVCDVLILYKRLTRSVLEHDCITFDRMAATVAEVGKN
jgi:hypothetical protein